jgi:hypothetical protein
MISDPVISAIVRFSLDETARRLAYPIGPRCRIPWQPEAVVGGLAQALSAMATLPIAGTVKGVCNNA